MGTCIDIICHNCEEKYSPTPGKYAEILSNADTLKKVGAFVLKHKGHEIEAVDDDDNRSFDDHKICLPFSLSCGITNV